MSALPLTMRSDPAPELSVLRQIFQTANSIKETCPPSTPPTLHVSTSPPVIELPPPPSIEAKLHMLGLNPRLIDRVSHIYSLRSGELHLAVSDTLKRACAELTAVPQHPALMPLSCLLDGVVKAHTVSYRRALLRLEQSAIGLASNWKSAQDIQTTKKDATERKSFNHEFTPFLQKYFEYNAFPSAADRAEMAKKSSMEPRQIEVWFQNHRRRARQEGRAIPKLRAADRAPLDMCIKSMEEKMEPYIVPVEMRQSLDSDASEAGSDDEEADDEFDDEKTEEFHLTYPLDPRAARHAFPTPWSRSRHMVSTIQSTQTFTFPPPVWPRKAFTPVKRNPVTMDECELAFRSLHVHDARAVFSAPFATTLATRLLVAPHFALVRGKVTIPPVSATTALTVAPTPRVPAPRRAPRANHHPFRSPSPFAQPTTLVSTTSRRKKKVAGPPRRTPKRASGAHRGASPATSERSMSPPSRASSFGSNGSSPSRAPSFGSSGFSSRSSSSSSSGPSTPTGSPTALPLEIADSYLDVFGDRYPSPVDAAGYPQYQLGGKQQRQFAFAGYAG
ncbi:hypothetical protein C8R43DRAFT_1063532 [Mycena crocata]|nr:hypothetical protein C8R43DRAFT_1063532 [Mycena crocata]